ncbi:MAG: TolC family protein [Flavobacteriales bacterium]|nr:TolC family protein [Flavobacteriales bacterium]
MKNTFVLLALIVMNSFAFSQKELTLDQAVVIAMENNYDIRIVSNSVEVAENNQSVKNSGYLPTVAVSAGGNYSNNNATIETQAGVEQTITGIEANSYNASIGVNYVLFNGMNRKNAFEKLKRSYDLANVQRQVQIDNTILAVYNAYYELAKSDIMQAILQESFEISQNRLRRLEYQKEFGQTTSLEILNAQVDMNNDSMSMVNGLLANENARRNLNYLLGFPADELVQVDRKVDVSTLLDFNTLSANMLENNSTAKQFELNKELANYDLKTSQSGWMPTVSTNVSYGLNNANNGPASFLARQNITGLNAGVNLTWNIFDGGATSTRVANAKIAVDNQNLYKEQIDLSLKNQLANAWASYMNQLAVINFEETNVEVSEQNFLKTEEQYKLGQVNSTDFRQAQLNLINARVNLETAKFNVKIAEAQLKMLEGTLVQ